MKIIKKYTHTLHYTGCCHVIIIIMAAVLLISVYGSLYTAVMFPCAVHTHTYTYHKCVCV